jgi:D-arabinose 1-dehydrogenase-like Zn-dependent alcohol dehydrogenase
MPLECLSRDPAGVIGVGALGHRAVQLLRALAVRIIAADAGRGEAKAGEAVRGG